MEVNDSTDGRDECIGSISIAAFQILRYIRRREYLEIPLEPGHFSKCASTTYDGINDTSGEAGKIPRLCLSFSTLSDESIVTIMRKKVCFSLMRDTFTGWKDTCGNVVQKIRQTLEEVFAQYAVVFPYEQKVKGTKKKKKKPSVADITRDKTEELKKELEDQQRRKDHWHRQVTEFYKKHHPKKAHYALVMNLMGKHDGNEEALFKKLHKKYNVDIEDNQHAFTHEHNKHGKLKEKKSIKTERVKLLTKGLAGVLISHDGMIKLYQQSNLFSDQCESILVRIKK
jgi:hypothetical protein